jgi:hypothetical protein
MIRRITYRDGQVVTASQLCDLTGVTEGSSHDDGLVVILLVVVENALNGLDTGILLGAEVALVRSLVPVQDTADEGGDEESTGLSSSNGLDKGEHEGQVAVDAVLRLQDVGGLDTLPGGGDLDKDTVLGDALLLVELRESAMSRHLLIRSGLAYLDDVKGLVDGSLGVEGPTSIDLSGDLSGDDLEDLLAELNEKVVEGSVDLLIKSLALSGGSVTDQYHAAFHRVTDLLLALLDGSVDQAGVLGLLRSSQDQGGVGGSILRFVLANGCRVVNIGIEAEQH